MESFVLPAPLLFYQSNPKVPTPMADSDPIPIPSPPASTADSLTSPPKKDDLQPVATKVAELNEAQSELLSRLQGLKLDLQNWRTVLDTQVKTYKDELSELKSRLNTDLEQLTSDFHDLRTTLQKQQEEVTASLKNLGLNDAAETHPARESTSINDKVEQQDSSLHGTKDFKHLDEDVEKSPLKEDYAS